ncbi:MAG: hypothetical protein H7067_10890 [Burkholderiales bacterium]|nr:hypothetical protein [Opitutaceae bacterium]
MKPRLAALLTVAAFTAGLRADDTSALIDASFQTHPPGATDLAPREPAASASVAEEFERSFSAPRLLSLDYSPPVTTLIETLLRAIEAEPVTRAAMPGANEKTLEDRLVVELAREVLRLRAETDALRAEIERLKTP